MNSKKNAWCISQIDLILQEKKGLLISRIQIESTIQTSISTGSIFFSVFPCFPHMLVHDFPIFTFPLQAAMISKSSTVLAAAASWPSMNSGCSVPRTFGQDAAPSPAMDFPEFSPMGENMGFNPISSS